MFFDFVHEIFHPLATADHRLWTVLSGPFFCLTGHAMPADWATVGADFLSDALLVPAARLARAKSLDVSTERMKSVAQAALHTFEERTLGTQMLVFGNVAVVMAASEMLENATNVNHAVSAYLLVKDEGNWRIAAHAWDHASEHTLVPENLRY